VAWRDPLGFRLVDLVNDTAARVGIFESIAVDPAIASVTRITNMHVVDSVDGLVAVNGDDMSRAILPVDAHPDGMPSVQFHWNGCEEWGSRDDASKVSGNKKGVICEPRDVALRSRAVRAACICSQGLSTRKH
jgi:hypothetical protein